MTRNEILALVAKRDVAHADYKQARDERDAARDADRESLSEHRLVCGEVAELKAKADELRSESLAKRRAAQKATREADRACNVAWREYRELDSQVGPAMVELKLSS